MSATYEIRTIKDFLAVPAEKREAMLRDFLQWMTLCDVIAGKFTPKWVQVGDVFRWIDDGKTGLVKIVMIPMEGKE